MSSSSKQQKPNKHKAKLKKARRLAGVNSSPFTSNGWIRQKIKTEDEVAAKIRKSKLKGMELEKV